MAKSCHILLVFGAVPLWTQIVVVPPAVDGESTKEINGVGGPADGVLVTILGPQLFLPHLLTDFVKN